TLTTNEMTCVKLIVPQSPLAVTEYNVEGTYFTPVGKILVKEDSLWKQFGNIKNSDAHLIWLAKCASNCNNSKLVYHGGKFDIQGEPTEAAILVLIEKMGCPDSALNERNLQIRNRLDPMVFCNYWKNQSKILATLEFTRERKSMSVLCKDEKIDGNILYVKGAPESIIERCSSCMLPDGKCFTLTDEMKQNLLKNVNFMAKEALRVLAFAISYECGSLSSYTGPSHPAHQHLLDHSNYANAGIKVMMITGDNQTTAESIALKIGILSSPSRSTVDNVQPHMASISSTYPMKSVTEFDQCKIKREKNGLVFSRMEPRHKQIVVKSLKNKNEVVAVTGDGVNDAPALKMADIGISMGITGTEVAKEASDMILADDDFSNIVAAVQEGRSIYNNMKAFIRYLISSNIGEVASIFFTAALGIPEGLVPVQLLWVNLVTDGLPAIALGIIYFKEFIIFDGSIHERIHRRKCIYIYTFTPLSSPPPLSSFTFTSSFTSPFTFTSIFLHLSFHLLLFLHLHLFFHLHLSFHLPSPSPLPSPPSSFTSLFLHLPLPSPPPLPSPLLSSSFTSLSTLLLVYFSILGFNPPDTNVMNMPPRRRDEKLISGWVFFRYLMIGLYVGAATVGIFIWWYVLGVDPTDGHTLIPFSYLSKWGECNRWEEFSVNTIYGMNPEDPCTYFTAGKIKASTLCLTVLVIIEMLNALNALSEYESLLRMPPWANPYLMLAIGGSILVHCGILYIPFLAKMFGVVPLSLHDWGWVIVWSLPVIFIDEFLKFFGRSVILNTSRGNKILSENKLINPPATSLKWD
ncbi:sarco/endoplasmic reticulum Ca2+-ATPase, partial [Cardiosporidium cionae]